MLLVSPRLGSYGSHFAWGSLLKLAVLQLFGVGVLAENAFRQVEELVDPVQEAEPTDEARPERMLLHQLTETEIQEFRLQPRCDRRFSTSLVQFLVHMLGTGASQKDFYAR